MPTCTAIRDDLQVAYPVVEGQPKRPFPGNPDRLNEALEVLGGFDLQLLPEEVDDGPRNAASPHPGSPRPGRRRRAPAGRSPAAGSLDRDQAGLDRLTVASGPHLQLT